MAAPILRNGYGAQMPTPVPEPTADQYANEYAQGRARIRAFLAPLGEEVAATSVPTCPAWVVRDLMAHLAGVCADLVHRRNPGTDVQAWVDAQVDERRGRTLASLLDEWDEVGPRFEDAIRKVPRAFGGLVYDVVAHEHDLRGALGRPGDRDTGGVRTSLCIMAAALATDLSAHGLAPVRLVAGDDEWQAGSGRPGLTLELASAWELMRAVGSRRSEGQLRALPWHGDLNAYLGALAHLPLPVTDITE